MSSRKVPEQYIRTRADHKAIAEGAYWDQSKGDEVVRFFEETLRLSSGPKAYEPFTLYDLQISEVIYPLFCWRRADGRRRFTKCLITSGKKNFGKTAIAAGLALWHLLMDGETSPKVVLGACTREQAEELYKEVLFSVRHSDRLVEARSERKVREQAHSPFPVLHTKPSTKYISYPANNGELKAVSFESSGKGGWNNSFICLDEVALMKDDSLYQMLKPSMKARKQPLMLLLSNAGFDKQHFYYTDVYAPGKAILNNESDDTTFLPVIFEVPQEADWKEERNWHLANPGILHGIVDIETIKEECEEVKRNKANEMHFRRFTCNQFVSKQQAWVDLEDWDKCKSGYLPITNDSLVFVAADLSATTDLTSICAVYPLGGKYYVRSHNFVPRAAIKRREAMNLRDYQQFEFDGSLRVQDGNCIDYEEVKECIKKVPGKCKMVVFDKWNSLAIAQQLQREGFDVLHFPQTHAYFNEPTKKLEQLILDGKIVHDGNSCLRWALNNVQLDINEQGLCKPKKGSDYAKIDPVVALLMGLSQALLHDAAPVTPKKSVYDTRGIISVRAR